MSVSLDYNIPLFEIPLKLVLTNDPDELFTDFEIDEDISATDGFSLRMMRMNDDTPEYAIICVFNSDISPTVGLAAREAYIATEILFKHIGEDSESYRVKGRIVEWIANKIDLLLYQTY